MLILLLVFISALGVGRKTGRHFIFITASTLILSAVGQEPCTEPPCPDPEPPCLEPPCPEPPGPEPPGPEPPGPEPPGPEPPGPEPPGPEPPGPEPPCIEPPCLEPPGPEPPGPEPPGPEPPGPEPPCPQIFAPEPQNPNADNFVCRRAGYFKGGTPNVYYQCIAYSPGMFVAYRYTCPSNNYFDESLERCVEQICR